MSKVQEVAIERFIVKAEKKMKKAIESEDWATVIVAEAYINGLAQALAVIQVSK